MPPAVGEPEQKDLAASTVSGIGWSAATGLVRQVVQFGAQIALARILLPRDFGILGMVLVFGNLISVIADGGYGAALIQRPVVEERHLRSVFVLTSGLGLVMAAALVAGSGWLARFYHEPRVRTVATIVAISYVTTSVETVFESICYRNLRYKLLSVVDLVATAIAAAVAIECALRGMGAKSLGIQLVVFSVIRLVVLVAAARWRPSVKIDRRSVIELSRFSLSLLGFNVLNFGARNGDNLVVGRFLGSVQLGFYSRAYNLMLLPSTTITSALARVMFPSLSRIDDNDRVRRVYLQSLSVIALFTAPMTLGLLVCAREFVGVLLGPRWLPAVPLLRVLSLVSLVQVFQSTAGWIFASRGRTDIQFVWSLVTSPLVVAGFLLGVHFGSAEGVAVSYLVTSVAVLGYPSFWLPGRLIGMSVGDVLRAVIAPIGCAALMAGVVFGVHAATVRGTAGDGVLALEVVVGGLTYVALVRAFRLAAVRVLIDRLPPDRLVGRLLVLVFGAGGPNR